MLCFCAIAPVFHLLSPDEIHFEILARWRFREGARFTLMAQEQVWGNAPDVVSSSAADRGIVFSKFAAGHRSAYVELMSKMFDMEGLIGPVTSEVHEQLVMAPRLLFATFDDAPAVYAKVALRRRMSGLRTVGLVLRPQDCFQPRTLRTFARRRAFELLRSLKGLTLASATPFSIRPEYARIAHLGLCDPQYWDLYVDGDRAAPGTSALSASILKQAQGRPIVMLMGALSAAKGIETLTATLKRAPDLSSAAFFVAAGRGLPGAEDILADFRAAGGHLFDQFLTDEEIVSLYGISDAIWACYAPSYNQTSGIFGRAMQFGVPAIVRSGSLIAEFARGLRLPVIGVDFDRPDLLVAALRSLVRRNTVDSIPRVPFGEWRREFHEQIEAALGPALQRTPSVVF